ncbi:MAG TPA: nucleoside hydrolase, partial [Candidatus Limnocylindrales bacterium]
VPIAAGAERPLVRAPWVPVEVHGDSGLDGADLPEPARDIAAATALEVTIDLLRHAEEPITLVPTGPLTNIALLLRAAPALQARIGAISLMGGSLGEGNTTPSAEFNIWADPEAAAVVFESGVPILMAGLDVTHQALVLPADIARMEGTGTRTGRVFADLMRFFGRFHRDRYGWDGPPIHDAVAVARLVAPGLVGSQRMRIDVETGGELSRGRTIADREGRNGLAANAEVGLELDRESLIDLIVDAVTRFP